MMSKCNTDGSDTGSNSIYTYNNTRNSSYTNDNNDTVQQVNSLVVTIKFTMRGNNDNKK